MRNARPGFSLIATLAAILLVAHSVSAQTSGTIFYTTFNAVGVSGTADKMSYSFTGNSLTLGTPKQIHSFGTEGVDAFSLLPNGNLLIGGKFNTVHNIKQGGALVGNVSTGGAPGYHVSVSRDGKTAYTAGLPGQGNRM